MLEHAGKHQIEERDLSTQPMSEAELDELIGGRDHTLFLNSRNELYRALDMKNKPPGRKDALKRMAAEQNLVKRPLFVRGESVVFGFDEKAVLALLK